jgi:hypothetical protein
MKGNTMKRNNHFYEDPIDQWFNDAMGHPVYAVILCILGAIGFYGLIWFALAAGVLLDI